MTEADLQTLRDTLALAETRFARIKEVRSAVAEFVALPGFEVQGGLAKLDGTYLLTDTALENLSGEIKTAVEGVLTTRLLAVSAAFADMKLPGAP